MGRRRACRLIRYISVAVLATMLGHAMAATHLVQLLQLRHDVAADGSDEGNTGCGERALGLPAQSFV